MSDEYTPTTDQVRERSAGNTPGEIEDGYAEFDRFLAAYEAEIRERIAQDIEGETPTRKDLGKGGMILGERTGMLRAARIARGATR